MAGKSREAVFDPAFLKDLQHWVKVDRRNAVRVVEIVLDVLRDPFAGLGKPEPLPHTH